LTKVISQKKIDQGLAAFHGGRDDGSGRRPRIIVGTISTFGLGNTFTRVVSIVLLEPHYLLADMLQLFERHARQGNIHQQVFSYLLTTEGNGVEARIMGVNQIRGRIVAASTGTVGATAENAIVIEQDED
jgi:hypothetical protein